MWKRRCERHDSVLELDAKALRNKETSLRTRETKNKEQPGLKIKEKKEKKV